MKLPIVDKDRIERFNKRPKTTSKEPNPPILWTKVFVCSYFALLVTAIILKKIYA